MSQSRTVLAQDPPWPGKWLHTPALPRLGVQVLLALAGTSLFSRVPMSFFPVLLPSSGGMDETPSAGLCRRI